MELSHHGIKGQRWGVRRYQNPDGTLTPTGEKRYKRDIQDNNARKKDNRIKDLEKTGPDPKRWVNEDLTRTKNVVDAGSDLVRDLKKIEVSSAKKPDLSDMSDQELREKIERGRLEQEYNRLYSDISTSEVSKGRAFLENTLEFAGNALAITGSVLGILVAINNLKNNS